MHTKHRKLALLTGFVFSMIGSSLASTWYVSQSSPQDGPGTAWTNAFHILQDGVDAAVSNDTVLVTNGTYDVGGMTVSNMPNRVAITKAVSVQSVNGPEFTLLVGEGPIGSNAVRCAYLTDGAELVGFTLTNGHTHAQGLQFFDRSGGGAFLEQGGIVTNCVISSNSASSGGGGAYCLQGGTLTHCTINENLGPNGGGVRLREGGIVSNCTISGNSARYGGGVKCGYGGTVIDCFINSNLAELSGGGITFHQEDDGITFPKEGTVINCTISGNSVSGEEGGGGGISCFWGGIVSNCTISGNSARYGGGVKCGYGGTVIDCFINSNVAELSGGGITFHQEDDGTTFPQEGTAINCTISGNSAGAGGGINCLGGGIVELCTISANSATNGGGVLLREGGIARNCTISGNSARYGGGVKCVYGGTVIDCFINSNLAELSGGGIHFHQGTDGITFPQEGTAINCTISGNSAGTGGGILCYLGGTITDCTITDNLATNNGGGVNFNTEGMISGCTISSNSALFGGGINCYLGGTITDCTITNNLATNNGGGINCFGGGIIELCTISANSATSGGGVRFHLSGGIVSNCSINENAAEQGGGAACFDGGTISHSIIENNRATGSDGGGIFIENSGLIEQCLIYKNIAVTNGGGVNLQQGGTLSHCTISTNSSMIGGGVNSDTNGAIINCIVWDNLSGGNWNGSGNWTNNCTLPSIGINTVTSDPQFSGTGNYHLQSTSPCIDAGIDINSTHDFDGMARPLDGDNNGIALPDLGAYEVVNLAADSDADGLNDGLELNTLGTSLILANTDGDTADDFAEYVADTDGTNPNDWFRLVETAGAAVSFQSSANRKYTLYWSTDLAAEYWTPVRGQTDIMGSGGVDTLTDAYNEFFIDPACFYRVEVELP